MTMKKFSKTLTFESSHQIGDRNQLSNGRQRLSVTRLTAKMNDRERDNYSKFQNMQPLDTKVPIDYANGLTGVFLPIKNDFSVLNIDQGIDNDCCDIQGEDAADRYCDEPHWPRAAKKKVKRVRFVVCTLALFGFALGLMSRLILNVSIVEMVKKPDDVPIEELVHDPITTTTTTTPTTSSPLETLLSTLSLEPASTVDELLIAANLEVSDQSGSQDNINTQYEQKATYIDSSQRDIYAVNSNGTSTNTTTVAEAVTNQDDSLRFAWSKQDVNIVLGSFYMGYAPGILFSGSVAQKYGAKYPLFLCIFGSAVINMFTPLVAQYSLNLLIGSRVMLGVIQGSLLPCLYELFNRWLTQTESSIFAPMIKVSMPMGSLIGTIMPGILASFKMDWPNLFYIGGLMCLVWSIVWLFIATSIPQTNRFVGINELNRIMRKKKNHSNQPATITEKPARLQPSSSKVSRTAEIKKNAPTKSSGTPWLLIITSPSVLALTVVKFTYNIGMDFIFLQLAVYLREVHNAPIETISAIASGGYCMQMLLISFVGWLAKVVIINRACGLSVTKWRKIFQGSSNFIMAFTYLILAYSNPGLEVATVLLLSVCFWWMMGAGGESMLPYDLSGEYPASIVGFAHSISIFSGVALTAICGVILGEDTENPEKWGLLFYLLASLLAGGGLVFVIVVKAKPFLPGEKTPKVVGRGLIAQQQIQSLTTDQDQFKSNKPCNLR